MEFFHQEFGQGKPLIIIHGLFGSSDNWVSIGRKLAVDRRVLLLDQRNHGRSGHSQEFNLTVLGEDIKTFVDSNHLDRVDLIGHSLGGKAAMIFSLNYEHLMDKLIVVDIAPKSYPIHHQDLADAMLALELGSLIDRKQADQELAKSVGSLPVRQFLLKNLAKNADGRFFWRLNLPVIRDSLSEIGAEVNTNHSIENDTLFVRGLRSGYIKVPQDCEMIQSLYPNYEIKEVDAGHWLHAEKPADFVEMVENFLSRA